jgi:hypothetical protein
MSRSTNSTRKPSLGPSAPTPIMKQSDDKGINYSIRVSQEVIDRIDRLVVILGPRMRSLFGREGKRTDLFRASIERGLDQIEKEFGIGEEREQFVLVDNLEDFEEP